MPKNKDFALRIEIIDECLRNRYRNWTLESLINTVNEKLTDRYGKTIKKRTIQADLKYLIQEKGAPIGKKKSGKETYFFYTESNYSISNLPIKDEEIEFLNDAINILRQVDDFKILQDVDEIISKLQNTVNTNIKNGPTIIQFEKHTTALGVNYIDTLFSAIKMKIALRISYQSFRSENPKTYIFHPYLLKEYRNRWFIIGRKESENKITNLALDRIKNINNSNVEYIQNDLFNTETYFTNLIGVTIPEGETPQNIELRISSSQAPYIKTKPIHHTQQIIKEYKNGDIVARLHLICNYELRSVLLGFGCEIQVLKPLSLRKNIKEVLKQAIQNYH